MQESTASPACPMKKVPTTILSNRWVSIPLIPSDLQEPPALVFSLGPQMPNTLVLPECLQMPPDPQMPQYHQRPQMVPLLDGLQLSPGSTVNQGFQVLASPFGLLVGPEACPRAHVPRKTSVRPLRRRTRYSTEHKNKLEKFFLEISKYPSIDQRKELAESICVTEYQIRVWFKNRRCRYFREHPNEHRSTLGNQNGRAQTHILSNEVHAPLNAEATHYPMSPSLADISSLLQHSASNIFISI